MLAKQEGFHAVSGINGLYLNIRGGGCSWILRYMFNGERRHLGLGSFSDLSLFEVREEARSQRQLLRQGVDPIDTKRAARDQQRAANAKRKTFRECWEGYLDAHSAGWRNAKHGVVCAGIAHALGKIEGGLPRGLLLPPLLAKRFGKGVVKIHLPTQDELRTLLA